MIIQTLNPSSRGKSTMVPKQDSQTSKLERLILLTLLSLRVMVNSRVIKSLSIKIKVSLIIKRISIISKTGIKRTSLKTIIGKDNKTSNSISNSPKIKVKMPITLSIKGNSNRTKNLAASSNSNSKDQITTIKRNNLIRMLITKTKVKTKVKIQDTKITRTPMINSTSINNLATIKAIKGMMNRCTQSIIIPINPELAEGSTIKISTTPRNTVEVRIISNPHPTIINSNKGNSSMEANPKTPTIKLSLHSSSSTKNKSSMVIVITMVGTSRIKVTHSMSTRLIFRQMPIIKHCSHNISNTVKSITKTINLLAIASRNQVQHHSSRTALTQLQSNNLHLRFQLTPYPSPLQTRRINSRINKILSSACRASSTSPLSNNSQNPSKTNRTTTVNIIENPHINLFG